MNQPPLFPSCAWCGSPTEGEIVTEPALIRRKDGIPSVIAPERRAPICEPCKAGLVKATPLLEKGKQDARKAMWSRRQTTLL